MRPHPDAYAGMNRLYLSQHPPDACDGRDIDDPIMSAWLSAHLHDGARVLDAGCGLGFDALALHRGLPARRSGRRFQVYGADYSADMLQDAQRLGMTAGVPSDRYRQSSFAGLSEVAGWGQAMDAVTVNYAIYTQPEEGTEYSAYLADSLRGMAAVIKPGGVLALNLRDWEALKGSEASGAAHAHSNTHGDQTFHCRYAWSFGTGRVHRTTLSMWEEGGASKQTDIWFAERSPDEIGEALAASGLRVIDAGRHGGGANAFHTLIARKDAS